MVSDDSGAMAYHDAVCLVKRPGLHPAETMETMKVCTESDEPSTPAPSRTKNFR